MQRVRGFKLTTFHHLQACTQRHDVMSHHVHYLDCNSVCYSWHHHQSHTDLLTAIRLYLSHYFHMFWGLLLSSLLLNTNCILHRKALRPSPQIQLPVTLSTFWHWLRAASCCRTSQHHRFSAYDFFYTPLKQEWCRCPLKKRDLFTRVFIPLNMLRSQHI